MKSRPNPFLRSASLAASIVLCLGQAASAGILTWDGSDTSASGAQGGTGTWDTDNLVNWWDGLTNVKWPALPGTDDDALFAGIAGGTVTLDSAITANDLTFNTTGYILSGAQILTLNGTTPTITTASGVTATIGNNTATILDGLAGLTKAGAGTLTLNGTTANTFTGGLKINGGTLALDFSNFGGTTPFNNLVSSSNILTLGGGTLSVIGKSTDVTSQTFASTTLNSGSSAISINANGGTSSTLNLGTVTRGEPGSVLYFIKAGGGFATTLSTTEKIVVSNAASSRLGAWAFVGDNTTTGARYAFVDATGEIRAENGASSGFHLASVTSATTVYTATGTHNVTAEKTALALQANNAAIYNLGAHTLNVEGLLTIGNTINVTATTGRIRVGVGNELVLAGGNNFNISAPIADKASSNSHVTFAGGATLNLTGTSTYTGQTTVNSGIMAIGTNGAINTSSGIKINGGKLLQNNTATAISPTVSLVGGIAGGTIDGIGTINTVNVSDLLANKITNGNGTDTALTIGNLTFSGDATLDLRMSGGAQALTVTNTLVTTAANGKVVINVVAAPTWAIGTYNLIGYGSWAGSISDFTKGTIPGLGARQNATLGTTGATNGFITLGITGDSARWTGVASGNWTTNTVGTPFNWKTLNSATDTEFLTNDDVVFDDTATSTAVTISDANIATNTIIFNNSTKDYTIAGTGIGISSGSLTKNDSGKVTLSSTNTYAGATTINNGIIEVSGGSAISNTGLVTLGNTAGATFQVLGSETIGALSGGGATGGSVVIDNGQILSLGSGTQTFGGVISGQGGLTVSGATQTLTGANSYQGATLISSGTLEIGNGVTDGSIANTSGITTNGTLRLNLAADQNYSVGIDGTGGITKAGAGILTLSGTNSYSGTTSITSGIVKAGSTTALGSNSAVSLANTAGVTLDLNGNSLTVGSLAGGGSTGGTVALGSNTLKLNMATNTIFTGAFTGGGTLELNATGAATSTFTYNGASGTGFSGTVDVKKGILLFGGNVHNALGTTLDGAKVVIADGAQAKADFGFNGAYQNPQTFVINGTGTDGYGALQILGLRYGNASIGGLAVASDALFSTTAYTGAQSTSIAGLAGTGALTLSGKVAGTTANVGVFTIATAAKSLAGYSAFSGNINLRNGVTLNSNIADALGSAGGGYGNVDLEDGTKLNIGASQTIGGLSDTTSTLFTDTVALGANTLTIGHSTTNLNSTFGGVISGTSGGITKAGSGTLTLNNANTYTGTTAVNAGILKAGNSTAFGPAANAKLAFGPGSTGTVQLNGNSITVIALNSDATVGTPVIENSNAAPVVLTVNNSTASSYGGVLRDGIGGGALGLTKSGSNVLTLSGDNSYTGVTAIGGTAGGIVVGANNALGTTAGNTTVAAGTSVGFSGGINYSTGETIIGSGAGSGAVGDFTATSRGFVQSVSGNNTFGGAIQINATGITRIGTQSGAQLTLSGAITAVSGAQILIRAGDTNGDFVTLSNTSNSWDTNIQIFNGNDNATQFAGLRLGADNALPTTRSISGTGTSKAATTFDMAGYNQTLNGLVSSADFLKISNSNATTSTLTLHTLQNQNTSAGTVIRDGVGKIAVIKSGAFNQILQTANTYTGGTWIKEGSIILQSGNDRLSTSGTVTLGDTGTTGKLVIGESGAARNQTLAGLLTSGLGGSVVGAHSTNNSLLTLNIASGTNTFGGVLGGGSGNENKLALTKSGSGTLELTGTNTYTGDTTITTGTLALTGTGSIANSTNLIVNSTLDVSGLTDPSNIFTIGAAQTLSGSGTITATGKTVTINGTHAVGNSPGSQTIDGNLSYSGASSIFEWDLNATATDPGAETANAGAYDQVNVTGNLGVGDTGAVFKVVLGTNAFADAFWDTGKNWSDIFTVSGTSTDLATIFTTVQWFEGTTDMTGSTAARGSFSVSGSTLTWSAVPEPTSALVGLLIGAGLLRRRRSVQR